MAECLATLPTLSASAIQELKEIMNADDFRPIDMELWK